MDPSSTTPVAQAKSQIMWLLAPIPERLKEEILLTPQEMVELTNQKVKAVREILQKPENSQLMLDPEIFGRVMAISNKSTDKDVRTFRRDLVMSHCFTSTIGGIVKIAKNNSVPDNEMNSIIQEAKQRMGVLMDGKLSISKQVLERLESEGRTEEFWDQIKQQQPATLIIQREHKNGKPLVCQGIALSKLAAEKPSLLDLADAYVLEFGTGERLEVTKAILLLCGDFFKGVFSSGMKETNEKRISLPDISLNTFSEILEMVQKGKLENVIDKAQYGAAIRFLRFESQPIYSQEGVFGKDDWEKHWGKIGEVPPLPKEAFEPSPLGKDKRMIDDFIFIWMAPTVDGANLDINRIQKIASSDKFGDNKIEYDNSGSEIREDAKVNAPIKEGYWFAMLKMPHRFVNSTRYMAYENQKVALEKKFPKEFGFPTTREALLYCMMPRARSGVLVLEPGQGSTRCEEVVKGEYTAVGVTSAMGSHIMYLSRRNDGSISVFVVPTRRFISS